MPTICDGFAGLTELSLSPVAIHSPPIRSWYSRPNSDRTLASAASMACRFAGCEKSAVGSFRKGEIVAVDITFSLAFSLAFYNRNLRSYGSSAVPWYVWCSIVSVTFAMTGIHWDISWHRSIGRDSFWTPAHIMIHLCGVLAGVSCAY